MPDEIVNPDGGGVDTAQPNAGAAASGDANQQSKSKVSFSDDQQQIVDRLVDKVFAKAFEKGKAQAAGELESKLAEANQTIEKLNKQLAVVKPPDEEAQDRPAPPAKADKKAAAAQSPDIQQLLARFEELQSLATSLKSERDQAKEELTKHRDLTRKARIKEEFIDASKGINFFDPMEVFSLVREVIDIDGESENVVVKNPKTGQPRLNSNMEPMSLAEYLAEFAKTKPYMVKAPTADGGTGAGASRKIETRKTDEADAAAKVASMSNEEFNTYINNLMQTRK